MPRLTIGTPAYRSADLVGETLASIAAQSFTDFKVVIAVDGGDRETAEACRSFTADPRFELVVHEARKGWIGNLNWLMAGTRTELFNYWQHDDVADPSYLAKLVAALDADREAVASYCDVRMDDGSDHRHVPFRGDALSRVFAQWTHLHWAPLRAVFRTDALRRIGPLRDRPHNAALEDFAWLAKAMREGPLVRVPETLYFKRIHARSLSTNWNRWTDPARRWQVWLETGAGMLEAAWPLLASPEQRFDAVARVLARLTDPKRECYYRFEAAEDALLRQFIYSFFATATHWGLPALRDELGVPPDEAAERLLGEVKARNGFG